MSGLTRFGISIDEDLLARFDQEIVDKGYKNRSEAIRDLIRNQLVEQDWKDEDEEVAGTITLVYNHHTRGLSDLLTELQHAYNQLILSTMHVHLDRHNCLEILVVKGKVREAKEIADKLLSVKGVLHGKLTVTSTGKNL
ncbi:MAG: nickel-responsive transcriptional regulator NikR [Firmicutes bacterium]|nr:nickel-responsive transcriptional regulator NikR [Bacillota bacterium]